MSRIEQCYVLANVHDKVSNRNSNNNKIEQDDDEEEEVSNY